MLSKKNLIIRFLTFLLLNLTLHFTGEPSIMPQMGDYAFSLLG